jgi:outer membrane biosynthesis protein TonB
MLLIPPVSIKNKINIGHSNEFLTNASLHCSSTPTPEPTPTPTPEPTPTPNPAPQPSTQPTQETPQQQAVQQTAQQPSVKNDTTTEQVSVAKPKSVSPKTIKAAKKKYYVRIRTYKIVNGKKVYSSWSKVKSVKTK